MAEKCKGHMSAMHRDACPICNPQPSGSLEKITRYGMVDEPMGGGVMLTVMKPHLSGSFVRYDDIKHLLHPETSVTPEFAAGFERGTVTAIINEVAAIARERTDPYWSGHSLACAEIAHRLDEAWAALPVGKDCPHRENNPIADTHAKWCVECGAFHDGSEWIHPWRSAPETTVPTAQPGRCKSMHTVQCTAVVGHEGDHLHELVGWRDEQHPKASARPRSFDPSGQDGGEQR